jgi:hypothetical protein
MHGASSPGASDNGLVVPPDSEPVHAHPRHRPRHLELADIVDAHGEQLQDLTTEQRRATSAIASCRTALLGGHLSRCDSCQYYQISYNSCRNRSCPRCQNLPELRWVEKRHQDLLPVDYHHVVFTIPDSLHALFRADPRVTYALLFAAVSETLTEVAANPVRLGAQIGFMAVLHTWTQTLLYHPHIHCIVAGGGLSEDGSAWVASRKGFFLPVRVLATVFRGKLLSSLQTALESDTLQAPHDPDPQRALRRAASKKWCVYSKPSFAGPEHVIRYLGRYTHRIAISNERLVAMKDDQVTFRYKDRADGDRQRFMTLPAQEFLRRYLQHVLPVGFVRLRYYGFLANSSRGRLLPLIRQLLGVIVGLLTPAVVPETWQEQVLRLTGRDVTACPSCKHGHLIDAGIIPPAPQKWNTPGRATSP